jgi:cytochrome c551/c552
MNFFQKFIDYRFLGVLLLTFTGMAVAQSAPPSTIDASLVQSTRGIAGELLGQLGQKLKSAMSTDGPVAAVSVCKESAPAIARQLSIANDAKVTRVGTRVRNQNMGIPNAWQKEALTQFEARLAQGEKAADIEYWQVADNGHGKSELRYAKAIAVQPQCLSCHGSAQDIAAPLAEKLRIEYPNDQATGYSAGQLRGAVVVTRPLP